MNIIQDGEILYRYANPSAFPAGQIELPTCIFNDAEMSCDWKKLQLFPNASPHVASGRNMIVSISICDGIRNPVNPKRTTQVNPDWKQDIIHDPLPQVADNVFTPNPSHALIKGKKKGAVTTAIRDNSTYVIIPLAPALIP